MKVENLVPLGLAIVIVGFIVLTIGSVGSSNVSGGGVIFIGPIPIVFGSGPQGGLLALISLVAGIAIVLLVCLSAFRRERARFQDATK